MTIMNQVKLIHCAETIKGGIATYLRELLPYQVNELAPGSVVVVIPQSQLSELPVIDGVLYQTYADQAGQRVRNAWRLGMQVMLLMRRHPRAVLHIHSTFAGVTVRILGALLGRANLMIYCPHGWAWDRPMPPLAKFATRFVELSLSWLTGAIVCISDHERQAAIRAGLSARKLRVVLNGVAARAPDPEPVSVQWHQNRLRVLFVGRFDKQKGVDLFCKAMEQMPNEVDAVMAGGAVVDDSYAPSVPANVQTVGWVSAAQLESLLRAADVLIVPSRWEGFGLIAAEAMRAGLAVVAAKVGGLAEVVEDGRTGVLIEPESDVAICQALRQYNRDQWRAMGALGKERFEHRFTMERVHRELMALYKSIR